MNEVDALSSLYEYAKANDIADNEELYEFLGPIDRARLKLLLERLMVIDSANPKPGVKKKSFQGRVSKLKGRAYEKIVFALSKDTLCFDSHENIHTDTNEIDILIRFGAFAAIVDPIRLWGSHCICECKNYSGNVEGTWVNKLKTVLDTHNAKVGLLFSKKGLSNRKSKLRTAIQIMAGKDPQRIILCFNWDDVLACSEGANFLSLMSRRHVDLVASISMDYLLAP